MKISNKSAVLFVVICAIYAITGAGIAQAEETTNTVQPRTHIRAAVENRIEQKKDVRNTLLEKKQEIKKEIRDVRMERKEEVGDIRREAYAEMKLIRASSTDMFKKKDMRQEIKQKMDAKTFEVRKAALVKELGISLTNLTNISARIESHIVKAEEKVEMMEARELLAIANEKLTAAKTAVSAFEASANEIMGTSTPASTATEVNLTKPRMAGDAAIKAVKEARDAFQKVVVTIAHSMGANKVNASSTSTIN